MAFQAAINSAGEEAAPASRKIVLLSAGTYYVNPQTYPGSSSDEVGIYVKVDNVTIRGSGADVTRIAASSTIYNYGTVTPGRAFRPRLRGSGRHGRRLEGRDGDSGCRRERLRGRRRDHHRPPRQRCLPRRASLHQRWIPVVLRRPVLQAFSYMAYSWAKNIEADGERCSNPPDPAHPGKYGYNIGIGRSYRCVIRDSYAHGSTDENPGGQAYGLVVGVGSSACLLENNISVNNNKPIALNSTGGGNVIAYNYVDEAVLWNSPGWQENAIDDCHATFTHHDLIEGNWTANLGGDTTHGNSGWHAHLRNYSNGHNSSGGMRANLRAVGMDGWTHYHAYIGNVLGGRTVYETTPSSRNGTPIY